MLAASLAISDYTGVLLVMQKILVHAQGHIMVLCSSLKYT